MAQTLLAYGAVLAAALHAGWKIMPAALRARLAARIVSSLRRCGLAPGHAVRLQSVLTRRGACAGCDACNACGRAGRTGNAASGADSD